MAKIFILLVLLPHLLCTMVHGTTLCPEYLTYTIDRETRKIFGRIEILPLESLLEDEEIYLKVALNTTADALKENFRLELAHSIKEFVEAVQQGRPLLYHVYFPSDVDFPILSALWFNSQQYCLDPKSSSGNITANLELGHIVYPPNKQLMSQNFQSWYRNSSNYRIDNPIYHETR
ncbi:PREDICTED: uncharacterized protein LOC105556360 [Vollenhovia emeryi]|uniref:uncharacterized protein LOC105556360 n=1 Tax=Vollenhovia emeryi TaxID=411798 RepID=UPI0005F3B421|nr:PREDICTED: uncharacterized protein LOC105556360 [Vollenhovia emeryi]XP_011858835.1 PREDICTED: uncharacterized protein LOC105556360 [Vollenhovia emeryi]XP_011858836.1 PREDICTED: uncharacterized protein LOC105556360 [Vollenhovia emeryi]